MRRDALQQFRHSYSAASKVTPPCTICGCEDYELLFTGDRHGLGIPVSQCQYCGLVSVVPRPTSSWFDEMYSTYYWPLYIGHRFRDEDDMYVSDRCAERAQQILDGIKDEFPSDAGTFLDIGCGQGGILAEVVSRSPSTKVFGIEPSASGADFCEKRHGIRVAKGQWNESTARQFPSELSAITATHVMEHVLDPRKSLSLAAERLQRAGGRLYLEVPDISSNWGIRFFHIAHVHYFSPTTLGRLCRRAGLEPIALKSGLADIWPWACGYVCGKAKGPSSVQDVRASSGELERERRRILSRYRSLGRKRHLGARMTQFVTKVSSVVLKSRSARRL